MSTLPIIQQPQPEIRSSRTSKWRAVVLIGIHLLIALHITHWLVSGRSVTPVEPSEAMAFTKAGIINAGLIFFCVAIILTLVFGRLFCGWACHLVALQDLSRWLLAKIRVRPQPLRSRTLRWVPFIAFAYMFLWPLVYRLWIGDPFSRVHMDLTTERFWATFPGWIIGALTFLICGFVIVYFLGSKGFCTYACPYGAAFTLADRVAPMRIRVTDACEGCGHCTANCTSNVQVHREVRDFGMVIDDGCMKCLDCVSVCPNDALYYGLGPSRRSAKAAVEPQEREPVLTWPEEILLAVGFSAAFFTYRGLYGLVPFLMALGLSAVLAFLVLTTARLLRRPNLSLRQFRLKRAGRLLPAGHGFLTLMIILAAFWIHSGVVRAHQYLGEHYFRATSDLHLEALDISADSPSLLDADRVQTHRGRDHLEAVQRRGLIHTRGNAWRLAWLHFLSGSPADVSEMAQRAIELGEYETEMHHLLALEALREGDRSTAIRRMETAIQVDPSPPQSHVTLGLILVQTGDLEAAGSAFERGLQYAPSSPELLYNAGLVRAYQGDLAGAMDRFEQTLEIAPGNLPARENLAGLLASVGRFDESVEHYRIAVGQSPEDAETRFLLARALVGLGDLTGALEQLEQTLRLEPEHQAAIILRASVESQNGD